MFWQSRTLIHKEIIREKKGINSYCSTMSFFIRNEIELFFYILKLHTSRLKIFSSPNRRRRLCIHKTLFPYYWDASREKIFCTFLFRVRFWTWENFFTKFIDSNRVRRLFNHFGTHSNLFASRSSNIYENRFSLKQL